MRVAGIQHDIVWEKGDQTRARLEPQIAAAAGTGAELIAVTEMFANGFSMNTVVVAEPMDGPSLDFLVGQAQRHGVTMVGSISTNHPDHPLPINRLVVVDSSGLVAEYAKIHPFSFSGEDRHYAAGDAFLTLELHGVRCTFFVCYDLRFADEFWVNAASTDLFVIVANWPGGRRLHWQTLLRARAIENQAYVLGVNRVGLSGHDPADPDRAHPDRAHPDRAHPDRAEERLLYTGDSMLIDPLGESLATAAGIETIIVGEVDPAAVSDVRSRFPFQADRR